MAFKLKPPHFLGNSATYLASNVFTAAIALALLPIMTRVLSPREFGQVAMFQVLLAGLGTFVGLSAQGAANVRFFDSGSRSDDLRRFIGSCLLALVWTLVAAGVVLALLAQVLVESMDLVPHWLWLGVAASGATFVIGLRLGQWQVRKQAMSFGVFQVMQAIGGALLSLLLVVHFQMGPEGRVLALSVVPLLLACVALWSLARGQLLSFSWRGDQLREIAAFGLPLIPHTVGYFLLSTMDRVVIRDTLGTEQVGYYVVAAQLVSALGLLLDAVNNAYVPWLYDRLKDKQLSEMHRIVRWTYIYFLGLLGLAALVFLLGPAILAWLVGPQYAVASGVIGWLALAQAFHGMYLMVTNYVFYSKRTGLLATFTIAAGVFTAGLMLLLTSALGIKGTAMALAAGAALKFVLTWYAAQLRHPMPWFARGVFR